MFLILVGELSNLLRPGLRRSPPSTSVPSDRVQALIMSWVSLAMEGPHGGAIKIPCCQWHCALPLAPSFLTATYYSWGGLGWAGPASSPLHFGSQVQGLGVQALSDGNDPSAGSPMETLLQLLLPLNDQVRPSFATHLATDKSAGPGGVQGPHLTIQLIVVTGGVYKGQGHNQHELVTHTYWEFLVHGEEFQAPVPSTIEVLSG